MIFRIKIINFWICKLFLNYLKKLNPKTVFWNRIRVLKIKPGRVRVLKRVAKNKTGREELAGNFPDSGGFSRIRRLKNASEFGAFYTKTFLTNSAIHSDQNKPKTQPESQSRSNSGDLIQIFRSAKILHETLRSLC